MARKTRVLTTLSRISLGVVLILVWLWMYLRADQLFPVNTEMFKSTIQFYMIFTAVIFSWDTVASSKTERPLFQVSFAKAFPKLLLFAGITLVILFLFQLLVYSGNALPEIKGALSGIGLGVILLHAFFVATIEEKVFRNWLVRELRSSGITMSRVWILQAIIFAFFHFALNKSFLSILIFLPLALIFMWVRTKYSPKTDMANIGVHFAWNIFVLGFLVL